MRRFNARHDAILEVIASFIAQHLPESYKVTADLPRYQPYVFPLHIATTDQRPDIVVWSETLQEVWVIELTVCFETRYEEAHNLKVNRYADLMEQIDDGTYSGSLVTLEVGSRGFLSLPSFTLLKHSPSPASHCSNNSCSFVLEDSGRRPYQTLPEQQSVVHTEYG